LNEKKIDFGIQQFSKKVKISI